MIRKIAHFFRFATKAERLLLGYQACGYSEAEVLERWRADLACVADPPSMGETFTLQEVFGKTHKVRRSP